MHVLHFQVARARRKTVLLQNVGSDVDVFGIAQRTAGIAWHRFADLLEKAVEVVLTPELHKSLADQRGARRTACKVVAMATFTSGSEHSLALRRLRFRIDTTPDGQSIAPTLAKRSQADRPKRNQDRDYSY